MNSSLVGSDLDHVPRLLYLAMQRLTILSDDKNDGKCRVIRVDEKNELRIAKNNLLSV